jgi:hypothetical protein
MTPSNQSGGTSRERSAEIEALLRLKFTPATPSVEELHRIKINREQAFEAGQQAALLTELYVCIQTAYRAVLEQRSRVGADAGFKSDDPVSLPYWAVRALYELAIKSMVASSRGRGKHARWRRQYRADLIHWHRYAAVRVAIDTHKSRYTDDRVYRDVAKALKGSEFEAGWRGIKSSCSVVKKALKKGEAWRFYQTPAFTAVSRALKSTRTANRQDFAD